MPFCKRIIAPKDVCKSALRSGGASFTDLADVCGFSLCSILRQLSDLCRQSVSILEELEGEIASICHRSGTLESKVISLQRHVSALAASKPPLKSKQALCYFQFAETSELCWVTCYTVKQSSRSVFVLFW